MQLLRVHIFGAEPLGRVCIDTLSSVSYSFLVYPTFRVARVRRWAEGQPADLTEASVADWIGAHEGEAQCTRSNADSLGYKT